jgi:hypothetical protein
MTVPSRSTIFPLGLSKRVIIVRTLRESSLSRSASIPWT